MPVISHKTSHYSIMEIIVAHNVNPDFQVKVPVKLRFDGVGGI